MGVFFKTAVSTPVFKSALKTALKTQPNKVKDLDQQASAMAAQVEKQTVKTEFSWGRFVIAVVILALLGGLGIWSATIPALDAWSKMFLHCFEILFGGVVGLLGVESATK
jgi:sterol desaturase/sphingolipid hydroxylase (fatty acid hydroxylase superfamily)